jgi:hypothetical protein
MGVAVSFGFALAGAYQGDVPDAAPLGPRSLCHEIDVTLPVVVPSNVIAAPVDVLAASAAGLVIAIAAGVCACAVAGCVAPLTLKVAQRDASRVRKETREAGKRGESGVRVDTWPPGVRDDARDLRGLRDCGPAGNRR